MTNLLTNPQKEISLTDSEMLEILEFAEKSDLSYYQDKRNQENSTIIKQQIIGGKMAEQATYKEFNNQKIECTKPDYNIYPADKKTFSRDLKTKNRNLHIKSRAIDQKDYFRHSWTIQRKNNNNNYGKDMVFFGSHTDRDIAVFCSSDIKNKKVILEFLIPIELLTKNNLLKDPIKKDLKDIKKCFYKEDLYNLYLGKGEK